MKPAPQRPNPCPECGTPFPPETGTRAIPPGRPCSNPDCPSHVRARITHWCSPDAMDIAACGEERVRRLVGSGLVLDVADLYRLRLAEVAAVEPHGTRSAQELLDGLAASKTRALWRLILGLGIPHVDAAAAKVLARSHATLDDVLGAGLDQLSRIEDVGGVIAASLLQWHGDPRHQRLVRRLRKAGLNFDSRPSNR